MATVGTVSGLRNLPVGTEIMFRGKRIFFHYSKTGAGWQQAAAMSPTSPFPGATQNAGLCQTDEEMHAMISRVSTTARPSARIL